MQAARVPSRDINMYLLGQGTTHLSVRSMNTTYILGFKSVLLARGVHYNLPPYPELSLVRGEKITVCPDVPSRPGMRLIIDPDATLFIPKTEGTIWNAMNDVGHHLVVMKEAEFLAYPVTKRVGIILPQRIRSETDDEFVLSSFIIEPYFAPSGQNMRG